MGRLVVPAHSGALGEIDNQGSGRARLSCDSICCPQASRLVRSICFLHYAMRIVLILALLITELFVSVNSLEIITYKDDHCLEEDNKGRNGTDFWLDGSCASVTKGSSGSFTVTNYDGYTSCRRT